MRFWAGVLLVLALSPFTAPFATFDLWENAGGSLDRTVHDGAKLKFKLSPEESASSDIPPAVLRSVSWTVHAFPFHRDPSPVPATPLITPLRL